MGKSVKAQKQGLRDENKGLRDTIQDWIKKYKLLEGELTGLKNKPEISDAAKNYRTTTDARLKTAQDLEAGFDLRESTIGDREIAFEKHMITELGSLATESQKWTDKNVKNLAAQNKQDRETAAKEAATRSQNQRRAELAARMQIQPAGKTPETGGTQGFKRRLGQFNRPSDSMTIKSQSLNI